MMTIRDGACEERSGYDLVSERDRLPAGEDRADARAKELALFGGALRTCIEARPWLLNPRALVPLPLF